MKLLKWRIEVQQNGKPVQFFRKDPLLDDEPLRQLRKESMKAAARHLFVLVASAAILFFGAKAATSYFAVAKKADDPSNPRMIFIQGGDEGKAFHVAKPMRGQESDSAHAK